MAQRGLLVGLVVLMGALLWVMAAWPVQHSAEPAAPLPGAGAAEWADAATAGRPGEVAGPRAAASPTRLAQQDEGMESVALGEPPDPPAGPAPGPTQEKVSPEEEADHVFIRENGPLADYKQRFEREPRDSAAHEVERSVQEAFVSTDGPTPVFRSVLCRESICKIDVRVSPDNIGAYVAAMARVVQRDFNAKLATERTSLVEGGEVAVSVYAMRQATPSAEAAEPAERQAEAQHEDEAPAE